MKTFSTLVGKNPYNDFFYFHQKQTSCGVNLNQRMDKRHLYQTKHKVSVISLESKNSNHFDCLMGNWHGIIQQTVDVW